MLLLLMTTLLFLLVALSNHEHAKQLINAFAPTIPSYRIQPPHQQATSTATRKLHSTFQTTHDEESSSTKATTVVSSNTDDDLLSTFSKAYASCDDNHQKEKTSNWWFPVKPVDALSPSNGYDTLIKSAYLRHILVSSEEMADLIMDIYLKGGKLTTTAAVADSDNDDDDDGDNNTTCYYGPTDGDVFTRLAKDVSTCIYSREEGGKIGWVDNPNNNNNNNNKVLNSVVHDMIDPNVIKRVFEQRVKGGDVLKLPATIHQQQHDEDDGDNGSSLRQRTNNMWHIIRVDDLYIDIQPSTMIPTTTADAATTTDVRSKNVINKTRNKLKGIGTVPLSPTFSKRLNYASKTIIMEEEEDDIIQSSSKTIYTVPNAKYYKIVTTGCQMNVADSERIMGILENELGLQSLYSSMDNDGDDNVTVKKIPMKKITTATPDILLLNTCTSKLFTNYQLGEYILHLDDIYLFVQLTIIPSLFHMYISTRSCRTEGI